MLWLAARCLGTCCLPGVSILAWSWVAGGEREEGWLGGVRDQLFYPWVIQLNPMKPQESQGHNDSRSCTRAEDIHLHWLPFSAVHAVPGNHRSASETNLWCLAVGAQWGKDDTLAGLALFLRVNKDRRALWDGLQGFSPSLPLNLCIFLMFMTHQNTVLFPYRCRLDYVDYHNLIPLLFL